MSDVGRAAPDQLSNPQSMAFDSFGNIWVADYYNNRVQKFLLENDTYGKKKGLFYRWQTSVEIICMNNSDQKGIFSQSRDDEDSLYVRKSNMREEYELDTRWLCSKLVL